MLIEDDYGGLVAAAASRSYASDSAAKYPDLIDFIVSDLDQIKRHTSLMVDERAFEEHKQTYDEAYRILQEDLITMNMDKLNNFTSFIDLSRVFHQLTMPEQVSLLKIKRRHIVDEHIFKSFQRDRVINWLNCTNWLYPITTIGDGNCLCNAVLSYISGRQDSMLWLRDTLKNYMNREDIMPKLKERWIQDRKLFYGNEAADLKIEEDQKILEREWAEIVSMTRRDNSAASQSKNSTDLLYRDNQEGKEETTTTTIAESNVTSSGIINQPLTYLEDIHIFALANLLCRPIIVLAQEFYRNIEPVRLRGIYLPLLVSHQRTVKDPILIGYHNNHFVPLMFALDDSDRMTIRSLFDSKSRDNNNNKNNDDEETILHYNNEYFYFFNVDAVQESTSARLDPRGFKEKLEQMIKSKGQMDSDNGHGFKIQDHFFYNLLPLDYSDFSPMKIHFQLEEEKSKKEKRLLASYLNLVNVTIEMNALDKSHQAEIGQKFSQREVLCCSLSQDTRVTVKNGLSTYLDFLNQSIKTSQTRVTTTTRSSGENEYSSSPMTTGTTRSVLGSLINKKESPFSSTSSASESSSSIYAKSNSFLYNNSMIHKTYCKNATCVNEGFSRFNDFCLKCYERMMREREEEERAQFAASNRYVIRERAAPQVLAKENDERTSERPLENNGGLRLCASPTCRTVIVPTSLRNNSTTASSIFCDKCKSKMTTKREIQPDVSTTTNKPSYTIPVTSSSSIRSSMVTEIPIRHEPSSSSYQPRSSSIYNQQPASFTPPSLNYDNSMNSRYKSFPVRRRIICAYCRDEFYVDPSLPYTPAYCGRCHSLLSIR